MKIREVERLDIFYEELSNIHKEYFPDWRFGQLCSNIFGWLMSEKKVDLFFPEEDKMIEYIREYAESSVVASKHFARLSVDNSNNYN